MKVQYGQVLLVDNGGFFPEEADSLYREKAWFIMDGMRIIGTDAVGMSEKELKYGRAWLLAQLNRTRLNMVCANVWDKVTKKPLVQPYVLVKKGTVTIGIDKDGQVSFNGKTITDEQLIALLEEVKKVDRDIPVLIKADETTQLKKLAFVMDACRKTGLNKFSLQSR